MILHFFLAFLAALFLICAVCGVGVVLWAFWSFGWFCYDDWLQERTRRRNGFRKSIHLVAPHHTVGRDAYSHFDRLMRDKR